MLGGEAGHRGFLGGTQGTARTVGLIVVAVLGVGATLLLQAVGLALTLLAAGLVYIATMRTYRGSPIARWQARRRWAERRRTGTVRYAPISQRPADLEDGPAPARGRVAQRQASREWACWRDWPDGIEGMHWLQRGRGEPGIAWHVPTGEAAYLSVAFSVEGQIRGLESDRFLDEAMLAYGRLLARYASSSRLVNRIQSITRVLPGDSAYHEVWVWSQLDDERAPLALVESYDEVVQIISGGDLAQRHFMVARWPLSATFVADAARRGPAQEGWRALMREEVSSLATHLRAAHFGQVAPLSAAQLAAVLRHQQHPSWPIDQAADVDVQAPWLASEDEVSATVVTAAGPDGEVEQWWHRTATFPIESVETGPRTSMWLTPLLSQMDHQIVRTLSLQVEVVPASDARRAARRDVTTDLADIESQKAKGVLTNEESSAALSAARTRLSDLSPGSGHHGAGWVGHVTISARSRDELIDATAKITEAAGNAGVDPLLWLDSQQAAAAACTWPVARGMKTVPAQAASTLRAVMAGTGNKEAI